MGRVVGCVVNVSAVPAGDVKGLASRLGLNALFVAGPMRLPALRGKLPVAGANGGAPGLQLADDDSLLRSVLDAARAADLDVHLVLSNLLVGSPKWTDFHAKDNGGHSAADVDPEHPWLCPNRPKLSKWLITAAEEMVRAYKPTGILLEDFSIGSPDRPDTLFMCWCEACQSRATDLGYDVDRLRLGMQGVRSKLLEGRPGLASLELCGIGQYFEAVGYDTGMLDWLNFRADCISSLMYELRKALSKLDSSLQVVALTKGSTVSMLSGQRRSDFLRDATLCDFHAPMICGPGSRVIETIASWAGLIHGWLPKLEEGRVLELAAGILGHQGVPMPSTVGELLRTPGPELLGAGRPRELDLALSTPGDVPRCPAIDVWGLPSGLVPELAKLVASTDAAGLIYVGVPG